MPEKTNLGQDTADVKLSSNSQDRMEIQELAGNGEKEQGGTKANYCAQYLSYKTEKNKNCNIFRR